MDMMNVDVLVYLCFFSFYKKYYISYNSKSFIWISNVKFLKRDLSHLLQSYTAPETNIRVVALREYSIHIQQQKNIMLFCLVIIMIGSWSTLLIYKLFFLTDFIQKK